MYFDDVVTKSKIQRWARRVVRTWERRGACRGLVGKSEGKKYHLEDLGVEGRIILKWIFNN
jgi:hypothetical protein